MIKKALFRICLFVGLSPVNAQDREEVFLIRADSSWSKELFYFPLSFAPAIHYTGYEEARFPKEWARKDSPDFWSYAFAWQVQADQPPSEADLKNNLCIYFDGLMSAVSGLPAEKLPRSTVQLKEKKKEGNRRIFKGRILIYDAFTSKAPLYLYVSAELNFWAGNKKATILFRFSPKPPNHFIWKKLNALTLPDSLPDMH